MSAPQTKAIGFIFASLLISSGIALSIGNPLKTQGEEAKTDRVKELLKEKLSILQKIATQTAAARQSGNISLAQVFEANRAVRNAELELCDNSQERVVILEKMLADAKAYEQFMNQEAKLGRLPTITVSGVATVSRLDVEIALEREKGR